MPTVDKFSSRLTALHYYLEQSGAQEEIVFLRELMSQEGWTTSDLLPQDWFYRQNNHGERYFVRDKAQKIRGKTETVKFMRNSQVYSEEDIENIEKFIQQENQKPNPKKKLTNSHASPSHPERM